jgi:hypothetical protein
MDTEGQPVLAHRAVLHVSKSFAHLHLPRTSINGTKIDVRVVLNEVGRGSVLTLFSCIPFLST